MKNSTREQSVKHLRRLRMAHAFEGILNGTPVFLDSAQALRSAFTSREQMLKEVKWMKEQGRKR